MTNLVDFDRALGEFLQDGPTIAPEPPLIAAMAHARTTPRRRDPLLPLRRDVMARPLTVGGLRPALALAATALIVAAIGIAIIGSGTNRETLPSPSAPVVTASGSGSPSPTETPYLSEGPTVTPSPLPRITTLPPLEAPSVTPIHVVLDQCCSDGLSVDVVDESGHLVSASSGPRVEGASVEAVTATNGDANTIRITWPGSPCDTVHRLTIDPSATTITIDRPKCEGDSVPEDRIMILRFDEPVDATALERELVTGRGGIDMPAWTATGIEKAGAIYHFTLFDESQTVARVEAVDVTELADFDPTNVDSSQQAPDVIRLLWYGGPCAAEPALVLDATGRAWTLVQPIPACVTLSLRGVDITLSGPLPLEATTLAPTTSMP